MNAPARAILFCIFAGLLLFYAFGCSKIDPPATYRVTCGRGQGGSQLTIDALDPKVSVAGVWTLRLKQGDGSAKHPVVTNMDGGCTAIPVELLPAPSPSAVATGLASPTAEPTASKEKR